MSNGQKKMKRLSIRADAESVAVVFEASRQQGLSISQFVMRSATKEALRVTLTPTDSDTGSQVAGDGSAPANTLVVTKIPNQTTIDALDELDRGDGEPCSGVDDLIEVPAQKPVSNY